MPKSFLDPFKGHRFPREVISYAVWLYCRFSLSLRDVEDILAHRGVMVSCETINNWEEKFGPLFADKIRRNRPNPGDKWFLDEVVIKIKGETFYLWRAVDQHGDVLDIMAQKQRNKRAAKRFLKTLVERYGQPGVMITDKLRSYGAAKKEVMPNVDHRPHKGLINRAETSHKPTRRRERVMQRFKSPHHALRFCAAYNQINTLFRPRRHSLSANSYRHARNEAFDLSTSMGKPLSSCCPNVEMKRLPGPFFDEAIGNNGVPAKVVIDKSCANQAGLLNVNLLLFFLSFRPLIEILQVKYLNNIVEQDHRFIKKITKPMKGFNAFHSASAILQGIEVAYMIQKRQLEQTELSPFKQFTALAG